MIARPKVSGESAGWLPAAKPRSSSGLMSAGNSGSVAAAAIMPITAKPNALAYGRT